MLSGTGPPAPPPLRKSRWSWWKPVKGTSATEDYYYNVNSDSSRPGSSSSSIMRPSTDRRRSSSVTNKLRKPQRNSMTVLDDQRAEVLRRELRDYMKECPPPANVDAMTKILPVTVSTKNRTITRSEMPPSPKSAPVPAPASQPTGNSDDTGTGSDNSRIVSTGSGVVPPRSKNNRKSVSRPPPAWYNRPYHHRFLSEPVPVLQPASRFENENDLRRLPPADLIDRPPAPTLAPAPAPVEMFGSKGPTVTVAPVGQTKAGRRQSGYYPPAGQDFAIQMTPTVKDKTSTKENRKSGFFLPPTQDFAIKIDPSPVKEKAKEKPAATATVKQERRRSNFYPTAPEDLIIEIKAPAVPEQPAPEKKSSRAFNVSSLMAPSIDPTIATEALPIRASRTSMDVRSRRSSSSTMGGYSTALSSRDSFESRGRASSWGSQTSLESMGPAAPLKIVAAGRRTYADYQIQMQSQGLNAPWNMRNQRPAPIKKPYRSKAKPGELFAALPGEVLELILGELKKSHLQPGSDSCSTCWMRDCGSLMLASRKWSKFARTALYEDIQLVGEESDGLKKRYKIKHGGRLVLLRRTLRNAPDIAVIVRSLKVPAVSMLPAGVSVDEYHDLIASVVMTCPNLERLVGFYPSYNHAFSRLFHALSTRKRLKEMNWIVDPSPHQRQPKTRPSINGVVPPGDLQPQQSQDFYDHHVNWKHLTSLTVHCRPGATLTPNVLLNDALNCLPALQRLYLSHLPVSAFNDRNLVCLPSTLKKLTLSHLPGISTAGLSAFAGRKSSSAIATLTLIHTPLDTIASLARIFNNLTNLTTFSLVQSSPPTLSPDERVMLYPYLASHSLRKLHWDIVVPQPDGASVADTILSKSIAAGGFPSLRLLRAPNDTDGVFQSVCRPVERVDLPADRYRYASASGPGWTPNPHGRNSSTSLLINPKRPSSSHSRASSFFGRESTNSKAEAAARQPSFAPPASAMDLLFLPPGNKEASDLHTARLAAQARLEAARRSGAPRFFINVLDEDGTPLENIGVGGYMGDVASRITYHLLPEDNGGRDERGGLVGVREMLGDNGEEIGVLAPAGSGEDGGVSSVAGGRRASGIFGRSKERRERSRSRSRTRGGSGGEREDVRVREGCTGRWNVGEGGVGDKKDRARWMHTERGRWRGVVLS